MNPILVRKLQSRVLTSLSPHTADVANTSIHTLQQFGGGMADALNDGQKRLLVAHFGFDLNGGFNSKRLGATRPMEDR